MRQDHVQGAGEDGHRLRLTDQGFQNGAGDPHIDPRHPAGHDQSLLIFPTPGAGVAGDLQGASGLAFQGLHQGYENSPRPVADLIGHHPAYAGLRRIPRYAQTSPEPEGRKDHLFSA